MSKKVKKRIKEKKNIRLAAKKAVGGRVLRARELATPEVSP